MEVKVNWSLRAEKSLENIHEYITQDSEIYANKFITDLIRSSEAQLSTQTHIG